MKKSKVLISIFFILFVYLFGGNLYAYNLKFKAIVTKGDVKYAYLTMSAGASDQSKRAYANADPNKLGKDNNGNKLMDDKLLYEGGTKNSGHCVWVDGQSDTYAVQAMYLYPWKENNETTTYKNSGSVGVQYLACSKTITKEMIEQQTVKYTTKSASIDTNADANRGNPMPSEYYRIDANDFLYGYKIVGDTNVFVYKLTQERLEGLYGIIAKEKGITVAEAKSQEQDLRFSNVNETKHVGNSNGRSYNTAMYTAWQYYNVTQTYGNGHFSYLTTGRGNPRNSTVNEYDNILEMPKLSVAENNILVRHVLVDENGNTKGTISGVVSQGGTKNSSNLNGVEYTEKYQTQDAKKITYAGKYIQNGNKVYEFNGYSQKASSDSSLSSAQSSIKKNSRIKQTYYNISKPTKKNYTIIEFYYKEVPDTPVDYGPGNADAGKFNKLSLTGTITNGEKNISIKQVENESSTCNSGDKNEDKSVLYVPAGEKVNLKITSQKFFYKKLTQKPYVENGKLKWKIVAEMYVLNPNSSRAKNSDDSGTTFFGNTRENVINASSPLSLRNTSGIDQESIVKDARNYIKNSLKDYVGNTTRSISSLGQITMNSVGSVTAEEKNLTVNKERYNGKRTVAGDSSYVEYTFTYEKDKDITTKKVNNSILTLNTNSTSINIYTPLDVSNVKIKSDSSTMVNHSDNKDATQIQKGSTFTINPKEKATFNYPGAGVIDTSKYAKGYILVFDFGVNDKAPGTQFEIGANDVFTGTVTGDINQANNSFKIMGITYNEPDNSNYNNSTGNAFKTEMESTDITTTTKTSGNTTITSSGIKYKYKEYIDNGSIGQIKVNQNACGKNIYTSLIPGVSVKEGAYYRVVHKVTTINIGRIYGFRVTDCSDVNWKNVFRNSSGDVVNSVTGTVYFSGKKVYDYLTNSMQSAKDARGATNILPLAPYKSTTTTYIQAPKLGYRISFDLKTSGYYDYVNAAANAQRKVTIQPSYYFINKDGSGYTSDIELYYKNKSGKYVRFENSGYSISFTPNDGYRHTFDDSNTSYKFNTDIMSDKLLTLNISKVYELYSGNGKDSRGMMAIDTANNDSVQVWFGEFKLPNSTIAIKKGGNVNQPLTDGYIGVKFDIKCIDEKSGITLDYNHENTAADKDSKTNTTQWDYDEYLGYTGIGKTFDQDIPLQLEKGTWHINSQDEWNKIKGTVILYDADNRAADDFE